ncbi:MAG: hypothetical protein ABI333_30180 [bacterium]
MGLLFLFLGLLAVLVVLFKRASGIALVGSMLTLGVGMVAVIFFRHTALPELVGLLYVATAAAIWASAPAADDLAEPIGGTLPYQRDHEDAGARLPSTPFDAGPEAAAAAATGDSMTLIDHFWIVGLPLLGFLICLFVLDRRTGVVDGLWFHVMAGTPGAGFALGATDVAALFGLLFLFPGGGMLLVLPLTGLLAVLVQLARNRPTTAAAAMELGVTTVILNLITLIFVTPK